MSIECDKTEPKERVATVRAIVEAKIVYLPAGDWVVAGRDGLTIGIEVKTIGSLLGSFVDGTEDGRNRLYAECEDCRAAWDVGMLVVLGVVGRTREGFLLANGKPAGSWLWQTYQSILLRLMLRGIPVVQVEDNLDFAYLLMSWDKAAQRQSEPSVRTRQVLSFPPTLAPPAKVLSSFPGIGPELAMRIWADMRTVEHAASATEEEWKQVPGIGEMRTRGILRMLSAKPEDYEEKKR